MNAKEKSVLLKTTIKKLYEDEGRSISYIYRLLGIDRHTLSNFIKENGLLQVNQDKKKIERFLHSYKNRIIKRIKDGYTNKEICKELKIGSIFFNKILDYDFEIKETKKTSSTNNTEEYREIDGEVWKTILGYEKYEVSNFGRIRNNNGIIKPILNKLHDRYYIGLYDNSSKHHNLILARIVAHAFCEKKDGCDTVNHIDGNKHNNKASNLEWVTQSENNLHSYRVLGRRINVGKKLNYTILYKDKYSFKTIASFARFIGKSETQTKRMIENGEKHSIKKIYKHIVTTIRKEL